MSLLCITTLCLAAATADPMASSLIGPPLKQEGPAPLLSIPEAVDAASAWLIAHQDKDGHWDCDGFMKHDDQVIDEPESMLSDDDFWKRALEGAGADKEASRAPTFHAGAGDPQYDVGVTSLALLALIADGHGISLGDHQAGVRRGLEWLISAQDPKTGLFGEMKVIAFHYNHAAATLALASGLGTISGEAHGDLDKSIRSSLTLAVRHIESARNPYGAWRYSYPPDGDNDSSITAWMALALTAASDAGVEVNAEALQGAESWFKEMTDPENGRVGYTERGSGSSRVHRINSLVPQDGAETLTAGALHARLSMGADPRKDDAIVDQVRLMLNALAETPREQIRDVLWIYFGTSAMSQIGSLPWSEWTSVARPLLMQTQSRDGGGAGSWDPTGAWGYALGRVGTTALAAHALATIEQVGVPEGAPVIANRAPTMEPVDEQVRLGLAWLARHQDADGRWNADDFMENDPDDDRSQGAGDPNHDVGVTGLALLAFMADGQTADKGAHKAAVARGLGWLLEQQDYKTGLFGEEIGQTFLYDHAIAALAVTEMLNLTRSPDLKERAQQAYNYVARARNPYGVWRYAAPPDGENDTSVTAWMLQVVRSAEDAGLKVDRESWTAARSWLDEMTDPETGRIGYTERGSTSSRVPGMNNWFETEHYEALTAAGLLSRFMAGEARESATPVMTRHANLVVRTARSLRDPEIPVDLYALYYSSQAMYQMGGHYWRQWSGALRSAVIETQRVDGSARGSWDPDGPWGFSGGRVYSTAMMVLNAVMLKRYDNLTK